MKICPKCKISTDEFNKNQRVCRSCQRAYYQNNREQHIKNVARNKINRRGSLYGLSTEEYDELRSSNNGLCHLCNQRKAKCIDHDHITGAVRGHLCAGCNTGLGLLGDTRESLERAITYLSQ